jgi:protein-tyrosine phosphatase
MKKLLLIAAILLINGALFAQIADSAKRHVVLKGAANFRDLGGYATTDGHHVKWGKIYRSADISKLTDADLEILKKLSIAYDVDFRGHEESAKAPDKLNPGMDYILCPAGSDSLTSSLMAAISHLKGAKAGDSLIVNNFYSKTTYLTDRYKPFFVKLEDLPANKSLVFHCTAGKDRTGIGAALFLYALGVPYNTIVEDYTATNYYLTEQSKRSIVGMVNFMHVDKDVATGMMMAKKEYLDATFAAINKKYGSVDNFLITEVGLDSQKRSELKKKFLE